jgi:uncharacterized membrane protein
MELNFKLVLLTALIPLIIGFVWYHPRVLGRIWLRVSGTRPGMPTAGKMLVIVILTYVFGCMLSMALVGLVIHQISLYSILANEPGLKDPHSSLSMMVKDFMAKYGQKFRTFKHGAFHGTIAALFIALPVIGTISLFERRRFAYIAIHTGYWILTLALMGGVICQFA